NAKREEDRRMIIQRRQDSIKALEEARKAEEIAKIAQKQHAVTPQKGEKYEEVVNEKGIAPGYYLIANVFGTKRYFDAFMKSLSERGLNPKSFYRESKKYNYVYLGKYNTIEEAREARDSQLNGRYKDDLWIFRMVGGE
ncbi:MAG: SPOR domain-containing protein, partial [Eudoraea sp.]|nr:SPOR domain-containing protein [Eudoraea sp.]